MRIILSLFVFALTLQNLVGQTSDPVLFSVENQDINVSEFNYIYTKNNQDSANYSRSSLNEYLELYTNFKLKVQAAKDMQLDTIKALQQELAGYQKQLSNSYLKDKQVTNRLTRELYDRMQEDRSVRHILFSVRENAIAKDTLAKYNKALEIKKMLEEGKRFNDLARQYSEDSYSKNSGGHLGYLAAPLQNGFYGLENAAYNSKSKEIVGPVRTKLGYHIVEVVNVRKALGELEVGHILIRNARGTQQGKKPADRIQAIYGELQNGANFEDLAKKLSEDKTTSNKGGYLGWFGINKYEKSFENAAFGLVNDGDYSKPIQTSIGYHIIKRISKKETLPYSKMKRRLETIVAKDGRFELATKSMLNRIKSDAEFTEDRTGLNRYAKKISANFYTLQWKAPVLGKDGVLFAMNNGEKIKLSEFIKYLESSKTQRVRYQRNAPVIESINKIYEAYVEEKLLKYEEKRLIEKYPEFKALMREYEEGILLFEITKMNVWDKAASDTIGLKAYFENNRSQYKWGKRAIIKHYTVATTGNKVVKKIRKLAKKKGSSAVVEKYNQDNKLISFTTETIEDRQMGSEDFNFKKGYYEDLKIDMDAKESTFSIIEKVEPEALRTMDEARGFIIADYQTYLEKEWINISNSWNTFRRLSLLFKLRQFWSFFSRRSD